MKQMKTNITADEHNIRIFEEVVDYGNFTIWAKVIVDGVRYSAFYDTCNFILKDKNGKETELDCDTMDFIMSELDDVLGLDF